MPDFAVALAFYRDELGLTQIADWSSEGGRVVLLEAGRATLELEAMEVPVGRTFRAAVLARLDAASS